ncbi:MAG TPA: ankyrin repeat domain-containing protein [Pyrinomonadaceae bacterium]|jgi:hypothetical protein
MTPARKTGATQDAATLALWRAAENGDLTELASLLPGGVDVNARNEHGVTALMRAAQHGHARMVRALLQHGADANIKRNDKFTALALAAFFGHTEVVRTLMEYGADSQASTRHGTSPQMWATARTFNAVVKSLEKPAPARPVPVKPAPAKPAAPKRLPVSTPVAAPVSEPAPETSAHRAAPTVIRTLKDPPEIWDLVHEVPRGFNARSAFMTRLNSMRSGWAFRVAAAMILIAMSVVGVLVLRGVQARSERNSAGQAQAPHQTIPLQSEAVNPVNSSSQPLNNNNSQPATAAVPESVAESATVAPANSENQVAVRKQSSRSSFMSSHRVQRSGGQRLAVTDEAVQPSVAPADKADSPARSAAVVSKPATPLPLSPQLISPAKSVAPKGKVIQWP